MTVGTLVLVTFGTAQTVVYLLTRLPAVSGGR